INQNNFACKKIDLETDMLNNFYQYFKEEIVSVLDREQTDIGESWLELGNYLLEPISNNIINSDIIYFIPTGMINRFPLHSLTINNERLINKFAVGYLPTISLLSIWKKDIMPTTQNVIYGFGEGVEQEATNIEKFIGGVSYIGTPATKKIVKETINNKNIAYFSCHGKYSKNFPLESGITLSDGNYTIEDIKPVNINTNMVILSACQSALGTIDNNNEIIGFAQAFLQAGVKTVIASLWSVDIQTTEKLMSFFVENLDTQNKITALQNAQKKLMNISDYNHPFFHAGFILIGNWS
ncbi:MAG: CHAT domain-containing protein, partial [Candidatus Gastranaerophilales bacterium]|nr:CHAT domain-containing protein [Candidatus Gastranaerophilales bacterium]